MANDQSSVIYISNLVLYVLDYYMSQRGNELAKELAILGNLLKIFSVLINLIKHVILFKKLNSF